MQVGFFFSKILCFPGRKENLLLLFLGLLSTTASIIVVTEHNCQSQLTDECGSGSVSKHSSTSDFVTDKQRCSFSLTSTVWMWKYWLWLQSSQTDLGQKNLTEIIRWKLIIRPVWSECFVFNRIWLTVCRPSVGLLSAYCQPSVGLLLACVRPSVGPLLALCWPVVGPLSSCWPECNYEDLM